MSGGGPATIGDGDQMKGSTTSGGGGFIWDSVVDGRFKVCIDLLLWGRGMMATGCRTRTRGNHLDVFLKGDARIGQADLGMPAKLGSGLAPKSDLEG
jgi:hypothetical protein